MNEKFYSIGRGSLNINGKFYYGLDYQITDLMINLEQENQKLKEQLQQKEDIIDKAKEKLDKANKKIEKMFDDGDENKVIDDLIEIQKILDIDKGDGK